MPKEGVPFRSCIVDSLGPYGLLIPRIFPIRLLLGLNRF